MNAVAAIHRFSLIVHRVPLFRPNQYSVLSSPCGPLTSHPLLLRGTLYANASLFPGPGIDSRCRI